MKREKVLKIVSLLLFVLLYTACNKQDAISDREESIDEVENAGSRSLSFDEYSESNPTLHNDWENVETIKLNGGMEIDAPWVYKEGNSMNIPTDYRMDIRKKDGWRLLSHTMIKQTSAEPNYILFYNKYRGQIKGFYYSPINITNNSFVWTLESTTPSSIIPSNTRVQNTLNGLSAFITTSNIVETSNHDFGHLNQGWNAFSYELIYGTIDNAPIVKFSGYNSQTSTLTMNGKYSGEVIVPTVVKNDPLSGATSIFSTLSKVAGFVGTFIPVAKTVSGALSVVSSVLGAASAYTSESEIINVRLSSSGTINLTGTEISYLGNAVTSINNINLKRLNNNELLGLWNLKKAPEFIYDAYQFICPDGENSFSGGLGYTQNEDLNSLIEINPEIRSSIKKYKVEKIQFFTDNPSGFLITDKVTDNCYFTDLAFTVYGDRNPHNEDFSQYDVVYIYANCFLREVVFVNLTISFEFIDGSTFLSSRNFMPNMIQINNKSEIDNLIKSGGPYLKVIYIY